MLKRPRSSSSSWLVKAEAWLGASGLGGEVFAGARPIEWAREGSMRSWTWFLRKSVRQRLCPVRGQNRSTGVRLTPMRDLGTLAEPVRTTLG